jgi:hypothetical protein
VCRTRHLVVFGGDPARQVTAGAFHRGGVQLVGVEDIDSALDALKEIVEQGEGIGRGEIW